MGPFSIKIKISPIKTGRFGSAQAAAIKHLEQGMVARFAKTVVVGVGRKKPMDCFLWEVARESAGVARNAEDAGGIRWVPAGPAQPGEKTAQHAHAVAEAAPIERGGALGEKIPQAIGVDAAPGGLLGRTLFSLWRARLSVGGPEVLLQTL